MQLADPIIVLAHELLGHAFEMMRGTEDPRPQNKLARARHNGHDISIYDENDIRFELTFTKTLNAMPYRGLSTDPKRGESGFKRKGTKEWIDDRPPTERDFEK
jgi:hypothetical protein